MGTLNFRPGCENVRKLELTTETLCDYMHSMFCLLYFRFTEFALRDTRTDFADFLNFYINCNNFMIFLTCILKESSSKGL